MPSSTIPLMETKHLRLRPISEGDHAFLYQLMTAPTAGGRVRFAGATPSPDKIRGSLWDNVLAQFIVEVKERASPVGLVAITSPNFRDSFAYLSALALPEIQGSGIVAEGALLGFHYAFSTWPFRKIYMESSEDSYPAFKRGLGRFFSEEGRLKQHVFWNGRFADVLILATYRETWELHAEHFLSSPHVSENSHTECVLQGS